MVIVQNSLGLRGCNGINAKESGLNRHRPHRKYIKLNKTQSVLSSYESGDHESEILLDCL